MSVLQAIVCGAAVLVLSGCERGMHDMYDQAKYKPLTPTTLFADGNSSRPQVPGTVAHSGGTLAGASSGRMGLIEPVISAGAVISAATPGITKTNTEAGAGVAIYGNPLPITSALLARGGERFAIYCVPCHGRAGNGDGVVVRRGFPAPPSYHTNRLRDAPDSHFYQVISEGYGVMYPYADRISPADRWAIVAYIRALQLSQHVPASLLSAQDRARLGEVSR